MILCCSTVMHSLLSLLVVMVLILVLIRVMSYLLVVAVKAVE